jgi:hypothetical protein
MFYYSRPHLNNRRPEAATSCHRWLRRLLASKPELPQFPCRLLVISLASLPGVPPSPPAWICREGIACSSKIIQFPSPCSHSASEKTLRDGCLHGATPWGSRTQPPHNCTALRLVQCRCRRRESSMFPLLPCVWRKQFPLGDCFQCLKIHLGRFLNTTRIPLPGMVGARYIVPDARDRPPPLHCKMARGCLF